MTTRPLAVFGITYFFALVAAAFLPPVCLLVSAAVFVVCIAVVHAMKKRLQICCLMAAGIVFAAVCSFFFNCFIVAPIQEYVGTTGEAMVCALETETGYAGGMCRGVLRVEKWNGKDAGFQVYCDNFPEMETGEIARMNLTLDEVDEIERLQRYADRVYLSAEYTGGGEWIGVSESIMARIYRFRTRLSEILRLYLSPECGAVTAAMSLGDKSRLTYTLRKDFRKAGLSHLLVISGLHLNMLCSMLWFRKNGRARFYQVRAVFSIVISLFVMAVTGFTPSVCRAGITAIIYYIGAAFLLPADGLTSFAVAALILCAGNCYAVGDIGFQLSFAATLGMIGWEAVRDEVNYRWQLKHSDDEDSNAELFQIGMRLAGIICAPLFTTVSIVPVLLLNGYAVSGASVLANVFTAWLVPLILLWSYIVVICGSFYPLHFAYRGFSLLLQLSIRLLMKIVSFCAGLPFARIPLPANYTVFAMLSVACLILLAVQRQRFRWLSIAMPLVIAVSVELGVMQYRNTVQIAVVGNRAYPVVVLSENGENAVVFRGGMANVLALDRYMDRRALGDVNYIIDIRREPNDILPKGQRLLSVNGYNGEDISILRDVAVSILNQPNGNLVVANVQGWQLAVLAGTVQLDKDIIVDAAVVGGNLPEMPLAESYLTRSPRLNASDSKIYRSVKFPVVEIRPGKSVRMKGGKWIAE